NQTNRSGGGLGTCHSNRGKYRRRRHIKRQQRSYQRAWGCECDHRCTSLGVSQGVCGTFPYILITSRRDWGASEATA
ncbi:hypothetical protein SARC_14019, partial [Sphaeroforma arctica JP610]